MITIQSNTTEFSKPDVHGDFLLVKCTNTDFFVIGEIDVQLLRRLQSSRRSTGEPFMKVPIGFEVYYGCNALPVGDKQ